MLVNQYMAGFHEIFGLGVVKTDGFDMRFKFVDA